MLFYTSNYGGKAKDYQPAMDTKDQPRTTSSRLQQHMNSVGADTTPPRASSEKVHQIECHLAPENADHSKENTDNEQQFVSGAKLALALVVVYLACFLMLLDTSIVGTVSNPPTLTRTHKQESPPLCLSQSGRLTTELYQAIPRLRMNSSPSTILNGTEALTTWEGM